MSLAYELPHKLTNDFRLSIFGNYKILEKFQNWVETEPSTKSPSQKLNFGNSRQKTHKSRYNSFVVLPNFIGFLYFVLYFVQDCSFNSEKAIFKAESETIYGSNDHL